MRPFILDSIFISVRGLTGVGPKTVKLISKLTGGEKIVDALFHLPIKYIDRRYSPKIANAISNKVATFTVTINEHIKAKYKNKPYRIRCSDETGDIYLIYFHAKEAWLQKQFPIGQKRIISGEIEYYHGMLQMPHPDMIGKEKDRKKIEIVEPIYPMTAGLTRKNMTKIIEQSLAKLPKLPEWIDKNLINLKKWHSWDVSLLQAHNPKSEEDLLPNNLARERLAYDEMLANQLAIALIRKYHKKQNGRIFQNDGILQDNTKKIIPFELTNAQSRTIKEINADMYSSKRMMRLLQGDVGSGKTIVAFFAMLNAVACNAQAAIMAPTEILAQQHLENLKNIAQKLGLNLSLLTGKYKGKERSEILKQIKDGSTNIVIGTHALFQDDVIFHDLGLVVIDEQHRFGVKQRLKLTEKGKNTDILIMTATPIPRTLTLTAYGDMEVSRLDEKPLGRKAIITSVIPNTKLQDIVDALKRQINSGAQAYWVCPLIEESEIMDLAAIEDRYKQLYEIFGDKLAILHGKMKAKEKEHNMQKFVNGEVKLLVATTVIEVGVDVKNATIMVIEHAERFGLSQLHQLRGRIGRGEKQSNCILLYDTNIGDIAKKRLQIIKNSEDGFLIAEEDLKLRGAGEMLGTKQSGFAEFKLTNLQFHSHLLQIAHDDAKLILNNDPNLKSDRGKALKTLLYLFEKNDAIKFISAG